MAIGTFGDLIFEVSDKKILTPSSFTRSGGAVWADHPMIYKKPKREFMRSEIRGTELELKLNAMHGVKPWDTIRTMYKYMENGKSFAFVVGGKPMANYKMCIVSVSDTWDEVLNEGELIKATVSVRFEEAK